MEVPFGIHFSSLNLMRIKRTTKKPKVGRPGFKMVVLISRVPSSNSTSRIHCYLVVSVKVPAFPIFSLMKHFSSLTSGAIARFSHITSHHFLLHIWPSRLLILLFCSRIQVITYLTSIWTGFLLLFTVQYFFQSFILFYLRDSNVWERTVIQTFYLNTSKSYQV